MKKYIILLLSAGIILAINISSKAQVADPGKKIESEGENRVNKNVDKGVNKGYDKIEEGIGSLFKKKNKDKKEKPGDDAIENADNDQSSDDKSSGSELSWAKYDFIPGDYIIFEDNLLNEENGEFPSRWDLYSGDVEMAKFGGKNTIYFRTTSEIVPYLEHPEKDYLPEIFTLEFDCYFHENENYQSYKIAFYDKKNQKNTGIEDATINWNQASQGKSQSWYPDANTSSFSKMEGWRHISLSFNKRALKVYMDDTRLINVPNITGNPQGITIYGSYNRNKEKGAMIKNIRIASGGQNLYDKYLQDGKIVTNGIRFEVNEAKLLPESMGVINKMVDLMNEHPDISFIVEGHTDSDGDETSNLKLSDNRARTVVRVMLAKGIKAARLEPRGMGESQPIDTNATPEGKANNRRVEFVKM